MQGETPVPYICQKVINNQTKEQCGKPTQEWPGIGYALCEDCYQYIVATLSKLWGISKSSWEVTSEND